MDRESPKPMSKFVQPREHHPDNDRLLRLERERFTRILTSTQLRSYERTLKQLQQQVDDLALDTLINQKQHLLSEWDTLRQQNERLREQARVTNDQTVLGELKQKLLTLRKNGISVRDDILAANARIAPHRRLIARRDAIRGRIDEHNATIEDQRRAERDRAAMAKEANIYASLIIRAWNRLGYCHDIHKDGKTIRRSVRFERIVATPDEIQFKIDISQLGLLDSTRHNLPPGVRAADLVKPETLLELSAATERQIVSPNNEQGARWKDGVWLRLFRLNYADGLPSQVSWLDVMKRYNPDRSHQFPVPFGVRAGRHINWQGLSEHPHWLIAGQTGSGKTNVLRMMLSTWIVQHAPSELRIILIDLKRGGDLNPFSMAPHTVSKVITNVEQVEELMSRVVALMRARMDIISRVSNKIEDYNKIAPAASRMARVVIVFDEYAAIHAMGKELGKSIEHQVRIIATQSRSAGIHLILGTQQPYATDVVDKQVRANTTIAATGKQRTAGASIASMGTGEAVHMAKIPGRMLVDDGMDTYQVQMPYISPDDIYRTLAACAKWDKPTPLWTEGEQLPVVTLESPWEVFVRRAITDFDGLIRVRDIWEQNLKGRISYNQALKLVADHAGRVVLYSGDSYEVVRSRRGNSTQHTLRLAHDQDAQHSDVNQDEVEDNAG